MRTTLRSRLSLLFMTCALLVAIPAVAALADDIRDGLDTTAQQTQTITAGDSTSTGFTNQYWIVQNNSGESAGGCDVLAEGDSITATFKVNTPSGVTASASSLTFDECRVGNDLNSQTVKFTSNTPGTYTIPALTKTSGTGTYTTTNTTFTLVVNDNCPNGDTSGNLQDGKCTANTAPVATNDTYSANEDTQLQVAAPGVLGNDSDAESNSLTAALVSGPSNGGLTLNANGSFTYTPNANFFGSDSFTYRANDGTADSNVATVNINVTAVDDNPVAVNDTKTVAEDDPATTINVLANDTDIDSGPRTIASVTQPTNGTVVITNSGNDLTYTPDENYCNDPNANPDDTFTYTLNGGSTATVAVTATCVNDAPSFTAGANQTVAEDSGPQTVPGWASGISAGPADESGQAVDFLVSNDNDTLFSVQPAVSSNGALTYTSAANANGTATVTVRAHDSGGTANGGVDTSASQTFTITVTAVNDNPVIASVTNNGPVNEGSPATITVTANDVDGDTLSYGFDCNNDNTFEVGPQAANSAQCTFNDEGTYRVNVKVTDGNGGSATDFTSVVVNNAIPVIGSLTVTGNSGIACIGSTNVVKLSFSITDPGTADTHSGTINWGDGTTSQFTGSTVTQQHSYSAGTYNITVNASDNDGGNAAPKSTTADQQVSLRYNVSELQDPVNPTGMTMSVFKYGSTIPLKVIITDCNNQPVNGLVPRISFTKVNPSTPVVGVNEALSTQPNDTNGLMRDAGNGQYIYNLNTKSLPDGDATYNATITDSKATSTAPATYGPKVTQNFGLRSK